jgi:hypothetical protein
VVVSTLNDSIRVSEELVGYEKDKSSSVQQSSRKQGESKRVSEVARINS